MSKGVSTFISMVFVILITFAAIGLVLSIGRPTIDRAYDSAKLNGALKNLQAIDNGIREVASEGINAFRSVQVQMSGGELYVNEQAGTIDYSSTIKSGLIEAGTFTKDNDILIIGGGNSRAYDNSTSIFLENEILNVSLPLLGSASNLVTINTSSAISSIQLIKTGDILIPADTSIIIENISNTSWGVGYSQIVKKENNLPMAQVLFHVKSNLSSTIYDVIYSLPARADFLMIDVKNVTNNQTTMNLAMKLGATKDDYVNISNSTEGNVASLVTVCRNASSIKNSYICAFDNGTDFTQPRFTSLIYAGDITNYVQACYDTWDSGNYKINISFNNEGRILLPFSNGTCNTVDNKMYTINKQGVPSRAFNDSYGFGSVTELPFGLILEYDRIKIQGNDHFGSGTLQVCIQKTGEVRYRAVVNVSKC